MEEFLKNPITALAVALVLGAAALSGKFSMIATQVLLAAAWLLVLWMLRENPWPVWIGSSLIAAGVFVMLAYYFTPEAVPSFSGILKPQKSFLIMGKHKNPKRTMEIGSSGSAITFSGAASESLMSFFNRYDLTIESIDGELKVSTKVADEDGNIVAELVRNEWRVAPPPRTWDRNYTQDALEVIDPKGNVILQVRILPDRVQIQGEWLAPRAAKESGEIYGVKLVASPELADPGGWMVLYGPASPRERSPQIKKMFVYPSETHFGEVQK